MSKETIIYRTLFGLAAGFFFGALTRDFFFEPRVATKWDAASTTFICACIFWLADKAKGLVR